MNAAGVGAVFNTMNTSQVLILHADRRCPSSSRSLFGIPPAPHPPRQPRTALRRREQWASKQARGTAADEGAPRSDRRRRRAPSENLRGIPLKPSTCCARRSSSSFRLVRSGRRCSIVFKAPDYPTVTAPERRHAAAMAFLQTAVRHSWQRRARLAVSDYGPPYDPTRAPRSTSGRSPRRPGRRTSSG